MNKFFYGNIMVVFVLIDCIILKSSYKCLKGSVSSLYFKNGYKYSNGVKCKLIKLINDIKSSHSSLSSW